METVKCSIIHLAPSGGGSIIRLGGLMHSAEGSGTEVCSADQSARSAEIFSPSFLSYQDGLSWHLRPWETSQVRVFFWRPT